MQPENWIYFISCTAKCIFWHFHAMMISKDYGRQIRNLFQTYPKCLFVCNTFNTNFVTVHPYSMILHTTNIGCCMMSSLLFSQKNWHSFLAGIQVYKNGTICVRNNSVVRFWCYVIHKILWFNQRELKQMESILKLSGLTYKKGVPYWWYTGIRRLQSIQNSILENFIYQF